MSLATCKILFCKEYIFELTQHLQILYVSKTLRIRFASFPLNYEAGTKSLKLYNENIYANCKLSGSFLFESNNLLFVPYSLICQINKSL